MNGRQQMGRYCVQMNFWPGKRTSVLERPNYSFHRLNNRSFLLVHIRPADLRRKPGSVGHPFPNVAVELRRGDGTLASVGEPGELFCRGPTSFSGYWQRPNDTKETLIDGWITVGDIAVTDADGYISILDRKKDMVVTGGINVYPREIENIIALMPGVQEVAVVGMQDNEWGERLHGFIVPIEHGSVNVEAVLSGCRDRLSSFKVPKDISLISELPRNAGGKILKRTLRERLRS